MPDGSVSISTFSRDRGDLDLAGSDSDAVHTPLTVGNFGPCGGGIAGLARPDIGRGAGAAARADTGTGSAAGTAANKILKSG